MIAARGASIESMITYLQQVFIVSRSKLFLRRYIVMKRPDGRSTKSRDFAVSIMYIKAISNVQKVLEWHRLTKHTSHSIAEYFCRQSQQVFESDV